MARQLAVDFNRVVEGTLIRANARRAVLGTDLAIGSVVLAGDDDWGVVPAEVVEHDRASGALVIRLSGEFVGEHANEHPQPR